MKILFTLTITCLFFQVEAQRIEKITIPHGDNYALEMFAKQIYRYPEFKNAEVNFREGGKAGGRMNYHLIYGEMVFISSKGDTLAVSNADQVRFISIGEDRFFYKDGYLEQLMETPDVKLAVKQKILPAERKKKGVYGEEMQGNTTVRFLDAGHFTKKLNTNQTLIFEKESIYYFGDSDNQFAIASKRSLMKILPKEKQAAVESFLAGNPIDFEKKADLQKLVAYLKTL